LRAAAASQTGTSLALAGTGNASHLGNVSYKGSGEITSENPVTGVITDTLTRR